MRKKTTYIVLIAAALTVLFCACCAPQNNENADRSDMSNSSQTEALLGTSETSGNAASVETAGYAQLPGSEGALETVMFASDYQDSHTNMPTPKETLCSILDCIYADDIELDNAVFCGDYTNDENLINYNCTPDNAIQEIKDVFSSYDPEWNAAAMLFSQGNHDELTEAITHTGLYEYDNYLVYVLGTETDFPWHQGRDPYLDNQSREDVVLQGAQKLESCLDELIQNEEKRVIFIAGHVPLHYTARTSTLRKSGDNLYSSYIFDVVNDAAQDLNIIYFYGHNHSSGWDDYLGGSTNYLGVGEHILLPHVQEGKVQTDEYDSETLSFTYLNAGYVGYDYGAADTTLTCSVVQIYEDHVILTRYCPTGPGQLHGQGAACKDPDDTAIIPVEEYVARTSETSIRIPFQ